MADKKKPVQSDASGESAAMFSELNRLIRESKMTAAERLDLYAMTATMADEESPQEDFLVMYLSGDRDWKADFTNMYGRPAGSVKAAAKKGKGSKYDISKVNRAVVKKKK